MKNMFIKPDPGKERKRKICDIAFMVAISCFIIMAAVICLVYAQRLVEEEKPFPASVLILLAVCALALNCIYIVVAIRRMRKRRIIGKRMALWYVGNNIVRRKQKQECNFDASNSQSSPVRMSTKHKTIPVVENKQHKDNLMMAAYRKGYRCFMRAKDAMFKPITRDIPTHQYVYDHNITWNFLDETSSSELGKCVSYYPPTECDTAFLINEV